MNKASHCLLTLSVISALAIGSVSTAIAGERLDNIMEKKVLRVGTPGDYRPFSMKEDGKFVGLDIELVQKMADVYGWKVEFVHSSWSNLAKDMADNKFDVAVGGITRSPARVLTGDFLPAYAPFGKVALIHKKNKDKLTSLEKLNNPDVTVIKNPGGTNEQFVLQNLTKAKILTHEKNYEIPELIAQGKGDLMITENAEAKLYAKKFPQLHAQFLDHPLTPVNYMGFWMPTDDADFTRVMNYLWNLMDLRGELKSLEKKYGV